jgi:serine/threonine-protein kinase
VDEDIPQTTLPRPGEVIAGKYAIVKVIGEGGMGIVYEATHLRLRRRVALKMLFPHTTSPDTVARFEREARAAAQLQDRHVAKVLDVDTTPDGLPYLVMEFLEGHDLEAELAARGPLPIEEAVGYVVQVCAAMTEAHAAGIVHRDLKPSNLFLCSEKQQWIVKVLDFGISKVADEGDAKLTNTQASVGTPLYMSPEQVRSARHVDARTDIWSLGVILYELLAGRTPFEGSTTAAAASIVADPTPPLVEFRADVPKDLQDAIHRALSKDPAGRFPTATEFAQAIAPFAGPIRASVAPGPISSGTPTPPPHSRVATPPPRVSLPSYPRATEGAETVAQASPSVSLSDLAVPMSDLAVPVAEKPRAAPSKVLAMGAVAALLAAAIALYEHGAPRRAAAPGAATETRIDSVAQTAAPATAVATVASTPTAAVPQPSDSSLRTVDPGSQDARSVALPTFVHPVAKGAAPSGGGVRLGGRSMGSAPAASTSAAAPPAPAPAAPARGSANPLFL